MPELALIDLLLVAVAVGLSYAAATQVLIPILLGRPVLPAVRGRRRLERELAETRERLERARLQKELADLKRSVDEVSMPPEVFEIVHGKDGRVH